MLPYSSDTECVAGQGGTHPVDDLVGTNRGPKTAAIAQEGGGGKRHTHHVHSPMTLTPRQAQHITYQQAHMRRASQKRAALTLGWPRYVH